MRIMIKLNLSMKSSKRVQGYGYGCFNENVDASTEGCMEKGLYGNVILMESGIQSSWRDKPEKLDGDMYVLYSLIPFCAHNYAIDIKKNPRPSGFTSEGKGKAKVVYIYSIEYGEADLDVLEMVVDNKTTRDPQEGSGVHPNKKKWK